MTTLTPTFSESRQQSIALVVQLTDRVTRSAKLAGPVVVQVAGIERAAQPAESGNFVFNLLDAGAHTIHIDSPAEAPYYRSATLAVTLPMSSARWPAFPDLTLSDPALMLDDPAQPPAYRQQRQHAALLPTVHYPFAPGATLIRGTVLAGNVPLAGATVSRAGGQEIPYVTERGGEFALFVEKPPHESETATLHASHPARPDVDVSVDIRRGMTAAINIVMAP